MGLCRRPKGDTPWQLPQVSQSSDEVGAGSSCLGMTEVQQTHALLQGGIDEGESPGEAAARELQEETGISQASIMSQVTAFRRSHGPELLQRSSFDPVFHTLHFSQDPLLVYVFIHTNVWSALQHAASRPQIIKRGCQTLQAGQNLQY